MNATPDLRGSTSTDGAGCETPAPSPRSSRHTPRRRFPFEPVERYLRSTGVTNLAEACGVYSAVLARWRSVGLGTTDADRVAVRFGRHPVEWWPDFHDDLLDKLERGVSPYSPGDREHVS